VLGILTASSDPVGCSDWVCACPHDASCPGKKQGRMSGRSFFCLVSRTGQQCTVVSDSRGDNLVKTSVIGTLLANDTKPFFNESRAPICNPPELFIVYDRKQAYNGLIADGCSA